MRSCRWPLIIPACNCKMCRALATVIPADVLRNLRDSRRWPTQRTEK